MGIYKGSELIKPNDISRIYLGGELLWQNEEWRAMTSTESIPVTVTHTTDPKKYIYEVVTVAGTPGEKKHTWEEKFVNGVSTGEKRNASTITTRAMTPSRQVKGTKDWFLCVYNNGDNGRQQGHVAIPATLKGTEVMPVSSRPLRAKNNYFQRLNVDRFGNITGVYSDKYWYYTYFDDATPPLYRNGSSYAIKNKYGNEGPLGDNYQSQLYETSGYRVYFEVL